MQENLSEKQEKSLRFVEDNMRSDQQKVRKVKEFALYRGDQFLGMGTYKELSEISGLSISTLQKINGKFYQKQRDDYNTPYDKRLFLIHVGYTDDF